MTQFKHTKLTEDFLIELGFDKTGKNVFYFQASNLTPELFEQEFDAVGYRILVSEDGLFYSDRDHIILFTLHDMLYDILFNCSYAHFILISNKLKAAGLDVEYINSSLRKLCEAKGIEYNGKVNVNDLVKLILE